MNDFFSLSPQDWQSVALTMKVAVVATFLTLPVALFIAYILARWNFVGKSLLDGIVHLPLVLPPVVTGYLLLILMGRNGIIGRVFEEWFGLVFAFRWTGAALAAAVMSLPLMVRPMRVAIESVDQNLEQVAGTLGANRLVTFVIITLPLAIPGIAAAALLGFAKAMGEFGATITFVSNIPGQTRTLALNLYTLTQTPDGDRAAVGLIVVAVVIAIGSVIASEIVTRRLSKHMRGNSVIN